MPYPGSGNGDNTIRMYGTNSGSGFRNFTGGHDGSSAASLKMWIGYTSYDDD
jgi:hypothetical protein